MSQKTSGSSKANLDPAEAKAGCRKLAAQNRNHLAASQTDAAALLATHAERLIDRFGNGIYAAYSPIRSELSPLDLLARLAGLCCATALPITPAEGQPLRFRRWAVGDRLDDGPYGTKQPPADQPLCRPDVILAPMLAFDAAGWRLGYGGGFYDRYIEKIEKIKKVIKIGLAFSCQKIKNIPLNQYDKKLDFIITEKEILK